MTFLTEMKARAERTKAVWEQIDGIMAVLNSRSLSENEAMLLKIITLLSEQLRPLGAEQDLDVLTKDVGSMFTDMMTEVMKGKK
jgi:hypothetical protein